VEADFYSALSQGKEQALRKIAQSSAVDLIEVRIAQDLVAPESKYDLPEDVKLP
jgi:hypothetical protein